MTAEISAYCLVGLLDIFGYDDGAEVRQRVLDVAAEEFGAEVVAIVCGGRIVAAVGLGRNGDAERQLLSAVATGVDRVTLESVGSIHLSSLPIDGSDETRFVMTRARSAFEPVELRLCRAMIRIMRLAVRTIAAFHEQREAADRLESEVALNKRLAAELHDRHTDLIGRISDDRDNLAAYVGSVFRTLVDQGGGLFAGDVVAVHLVDDDGVLRLRHLTENADPALQAALAGEALLSTSRQAVATGALVTSHGGDPEDGVGPIMSAPIRRQQRQIGAVSVVAVDPDRVFSSDERDTLSLLAGYASVAVNDAVIIDEREQALQQAEWQATHDALTGLANRRLVLETIEERMLRGERVVVIYLDVDRFKSVNDLYGHQVGDDFLRAIADRLQQVTRPTDLVGRLSGDEFIVVAGEPLTDEKMRLAASRVASDLGGTIEIDGRAIQLTVSVGLASSDGLTTADHLINAADVAMYQAKASDGHETGVFDGDLQYRIRRRAALGERLRGAAATAEGLHVVYQPIVDIETRAICGHEALLRMDDEALGRVPPDEFIPLAEELGVVAAIDSWVLATAMTEAAAVGTSTRLSVNVSPTWLINPDVSDLVSEVADRAGFPVDLLSLEVTERVAVAEGVTATLRQLRDLGVRILLDDFGTGYSSLAYLRTLEIDGIKIDRAFLADVETDRHRVAILEAILTFTDRLDALAIAEGVECESQANLLRSFGCPLAQGFFFGRPTRGPDGLLTPAVPGVSSRYDIFP